MISDSTALDFVLFAMLPYVVLINFFGITIVRYRRRPFSYSSLSSQFLENRKQFWGNTAFHIGVFGVLIGHALGFLIPRGVLAWNARPLRLYVLEATGLTFGFLAVVGLAALLARRLTVAKVRIVTSKADWALLIVLLYQLATGIYTAVFVPWGSSWFASSATPYLRSIFLFQPDVSYISALPWGVKLHIINAWIFIGLFPFTRSVHMLVVPLPYLWRKPQVVRWRGVPATSTRPAPAFFKRT